MPIPGTKVGRVVVGPVSEDHTKPRPHYFRVATLDLDGDLRLVEYQRYHVKADAEAVRKATISRLKSAAKQARERKRKTK